MTPVPAAIGMGGNVGDAAHTLQLAAMDLMTVPGIFAVRLSPLYRTPAWGEEDQPDFINAVARIDTVLEPLLLLQALLDIERRHGRDRRQERRWGPRTLDLDILLYDDDLIDLPGLQVPHPQLHYRAFALVPLLAIWPDAQIPGVGPARDALATLAPVACEPVG